MRVHLINPSDVSFGTAVITPRWLYVLAAATPPRFGTPSIADETLEPFDVATRRAGRRCGDRYPHGERPPRVIRLGRLARARGAIVVFGGIHATLFPDEVRKHGDAHAVVSGDGDLVWPQRRLATAKPARRHLRTMAAVSTVPSSSSATVGSAARQPLHVGIGADGARLSEALLVLLGVANRRAEAAAASVDDVVREIVELRRKGFRFVLLADDNFYPVTLADLAAADRRTDKEQLRALTALRQDRFELMAHLEHLPADMVFFTQITMEAAEDPEFLAAMRRARIRGALVGVESVTPEGLKAVYKDFNYAGEALVTRLQTLPNARRARARIVHLRLADRQAGHVRGDSRSGAAQRRVVRPVRDAHPVSRHGGFREVGEGAADVPSIDGVPLTRYWLIPSAQRPKVYTPHPTMSRMRSAAVRSACGTASTRSPPSGSAPRASAPSARVWRSC